MKGKSYSIPVGMVFKKYYCHECESKLSKYKTHRVVTKNDPDYFQYQDKTSYPRIDHDVYDYHFKCNQCNKLISVNQQYIIEIIQKNLKSKRLSEIEIKNNYEMAKSKAKKQRLFTNIFVPLLMVITFLLVAYFILRNKFNDIIYILIGVFVLFASMITFSEIRHFKGKNKNKYYYDYSYEKKTLFNKLHTYAYNNRSLIQQANYCYCFHCKNKIEAKYINDYIDNGVTALCPKCNVDSLIPDCIDEEITDKVIYDMNKYWF